MSVIKLSIKKKTKKTIGRAGVDGSAEANHPETPGGFYQAPAKHSPPATKKSKRVEVKSSTGRAFVKKTRKS